MIDFTTLPDWRIILVTGPQRSGTRITAKIIAHDLPKYRYVDEVEIHTDSIYHLVFLINETRRKDELIVVQCPALCHAVVNLAIQMPDVGVIMCMRSIEDILASQERIGWTESWEWIERLHYSHALLDHWPIARLKYAFWKQDKARIAGQYMEVQYDDLAYHPLWVPQEQRGESWGFAQTRRRE